MVAIDHKVTIDQPIGSRT